MEYFEIRAFLIFHEYIQKFILFEISPIKTQNNTKNCIKLGTNITTEASKEWTLRLNPQKASMFSNERKFRFLDLSNPKPNRNEKSLKTPSLYTKIHHLFIVQKKFKFLLTLMSSRHNKMLWISCLHLHGINVRPHENSNTYGLHCRFRPHSLI